MGNTEIRLAHLLKKVVCDYLQEPKHRKDFEEWYLKEYGKPYEWKKAYNK